VDQKLQRPSVRRLPGGGIENDEIAFQEVLRRIPYRPTSRQTVIEFAQQHAAQLRCWRDELCRGVARDWITPKHLLKSDLSFFDLPTSRKATNAGRWSFWSNWLLGPREPGGGLHQGQGSGRNTPKDRGSPARQEVGGGWLENDDQKAAWQGLGPKLSELGITGKIIDAFIGGRLKECKSDGPSRAEMERVGVPRPHASACLIAYLEWRVHELTTRAAVDGKAAPAVGMSEKSRGSTRTTCSWCCVNKTPENAEDGELVFKIAGRALRVEPELHVRIARILREPNSFAADSGTSGMR